MASARNPAAGDVLARVLEWGLAAVVVAAPLPFGAVVPAGRLGLELGALVLGAVWLARAARYPAALPPWTARAGIVGLLALALVQALPLGTPVLARISPAAVAIRRAAVPSGPASDAERRVLGLDPSSLDPPATLSLAPDATASALRTGVALSVLLVVSVTVARTRGVRFLALALLASAAFQGLYGTLVLASGNETIWNHPKRHYLGCATGTFVNRNHYAGLLEASLPPGLALVLDRARGTGRHGRERILALFGPEGVRTLLLGVLLVLGLAGLLLSFSRAGIALGLAALGWTAFAAGRRGVRTRLAIGALVLGLALVPLLQIGSERLAHRYALAGQEITSDGGRGQVWKDTLGMVEAFPAVGAGFGSFGSVYPLFRSPGVRLYYEHAHNDLLQALSEGGLVGLLFLVILAAPLLRRLAPALAGKKGVLALGTATGLAALLLHALVDFQFHIPSNAAVGAILCGVVLGTGNDAFPPVPSS